MSDTLAASGPDPAPRARWITTALRTGVRAWRSLTWRHWLAAATVGLLCSLGQSLLYATRVWGQTRPETQLDLFLRYATRWTPQMMITACLLLFGLAVLEQHERGAAPQPRRYALLVLAISALSLFTIDPAMFVISEAINSAFAFSSPWGNLTSLWPVLAPWLASLICLPTQMIMLSLWTLVYLYLRSAGRTAQALAAAQVRRAEAERRVLAEQLAGAQAMVEPEFLFDTLTLIEELFERDPRDAQQVLDELIAFLRAALPPTDDSGSTVGQQLELVRARLEIERIRLGGRLRFRVDVPQALADRPFAPLLLLPLAVNAVRHGIEPAGGGDVVVQARWAENRLALEVADNGFGRAGAIREGAGLAGVRERLAGLYGGSARLVFSDREPRGLAARLEIVEAGSA